MAGEDFICWEALDPASSALGQARRLYEATQPAAERIPWRWIEGAVAERPRWRPGRWAPHLLLAAPRRESRSLREVVGFVYGIHLSGYGGYATYLGVDPAYRRRGLGLRLLRLLVRVFQVDAGCEGTPLPFVIWESRRPDAAAPQAERDLWQARLRLFTRAGAGWISGATLQSPDFHHRGGPPVPLQLFLLPVDVPAEKFGAAALRQAALGLLHEVYGRGEDDPLVARTFASGGEPRLLPAAEARAVD
jgi:GNAT superfamily N-acetyltransferase